MQICSSIEVKEGWEPTGGLGWLKQMVSGVSLKWGRHGVESHCRRCVFAILSVWRRIAYIIGMVSLARRHFIFPCVKFTGGVAFFISLLDWSVGTVLGGRFGSKLELVFW